MRVSFGSLSANAWGRSFLRHFAAEVNNAVPNGGRDLVERTRTAAQALFDGHRQTLPDTQARTILGMCSLVLAGYRELGAALGDSQTAFTIVKAAFHQTHQTFAKFMYRPLLWFSRDPVKMIAKLNMAKFGQRMYGTSMGFAQEQTSDRVTLIVNRCAFHQFFVEHGEPALTQLLCAWDRHWMDVLDASKRPVRTERPTTISTGADRCRFHFVRDTAKEGKPKSDVILERQT